MTNRFSQPEGAAMNMPLSGPAQFDPSQAFFNEAYSQLPQSDMVGYKEPGAGSGFYHHINVGTIGWGGLKPETPEQQAETKQLQQVFGGLSSGELATIIQKLPTNEMTAVIGALPQADQAKFYEKLAATNEIDIKAAEQSALSSLPKDDLAKALGEVLADPARYEPKISSTKINILPPVLID